MREDEGRGWSSENHDTLDNRDRISNSRSAFPVTSERSTSVGSDAETSLAASEIRRGGPPPPNHFLI
jgi:hypothetical protein